jgi:imidazole glycerol phosphate synthase glutamine amidotransferase subunit
MGNLLSVSKALEHVGGEIRISSRPEELGGASALILPGVGNFGDGMKNLAAKGFVKPVLDWAASGKPLLGICLGMQMLLEESEEAPGVKGLGVFKGKVLRFPNGSEKVPHMGWNSIVKGNPPSKFLDGIADGSFFYFVHSYYAAPEDSSVAVARCDYILNFAAAVGKGNVIATQFHPEKSQDKGLAILRNFVAASKQA